MGHIFYLLYRIAYTSLKILKHELQHTFKNIEHPEATQYMKVNWRSETTGKKCLQNKLCCCCLFVFIHMCCGATIKKRQWQMPFMLTLEIFFTIIFLISADFEQMHHYLYLASSGHFICLTIFNNIKCVYMWIYDILLLWF